MFKKLFIILIMIFSFTVVHAEVLSTNEVSKILKEKDFEVEVSKGVLTASKVKNKNSSIEISYTANNSSQNLKDWYDELKNNKNITFSEDKLIEKKDATYLVGTVTESDGAKFYIYSYQEDKALLIGYAMGDSKDELYDIMDDMGFAYEKDYSSLILILFIVIVVGSIIGLLIYNKNKKSS